MLGVRVKFSTKKFNYIIFIVREFFIFVDFQSKFEDLSKNVRKTRNRTPLSNVLGEYGEGLEFTLSNF